ncbi:MAG TPA: hypothetical protein VGM88_16865 [Kofleriaceae bacterium]|jgi:hypothetical protein
MRSAIIVVALVTACGGNGAQPDSSGGSGSDAAGSDAGADAGADTAIDTPTSGVVEVTITKHGAVVPGIAVYFQNADASLASAPMTDGAGTASGTIDAGGFVTAFDPYAGAVPTLYTVAGVQPGDHLLLDGAFQDAVDATPTSTTLTVTLPTYPSTSFYRLVCAGGTAALSGTSGTATLAGCPPEGSLLVEAYGTTLLASFWVHGVDFSSNPTLALSGNGWETSITKTVVTVEPECLDETATLEGYFNGSSYDGANPSDTHDFHVPPPDGNNSIDIARRTDGDSNTYEMLAFDPTISTVLFDEASDAIAPTTTTPAYAGAALAWGIDGTGHAPDFALVESSVPGAHWWLASPIATSGTTSSVTYPAPPPALAAYGIDADAEVIRLERWSASAGWDALRPHVFQQQLVGHVGATGSGRAALALYQP